jgi:RHS repeat-associated protein
MEDGATGLTYMKARYYDPVAMRFLSPDPVYVDLATGGNFNRYWYANNNPYSYVDPDGRLAFLIPFVPAAATALGKAVVFFGTATVAGYAGSEAINYYNETAAESDSVAPDVPSDAGTRDSELGCIYCVSGENTESGKEYVGSTDDLGARQRDKTDGRNREGAEVIGSYPKGDREGRQNAEQQAINDRGGRDALDNKRNEVRPSRWEERGIRPPPTGTRSHQR